MEVPDLFPLDNIRLGLLGNVASSLPCEKPSYHMCIDVILLPEAKSVGASVQIPNNKGIPQRRLIQFPP